MKNRNVGNGGYEVRDGGRGGKGTRHRGRAGADARARGRAGTRGDAGAKGRGDAGQVARDCMFWEVWRDWPFVISTIPRIPRIHPIFTPPFFHFFISYFLHNN